MRSRDSWPRSRPPDRVGWIDLPSAVVCLRLGGFVFLALRSNGLWAAIARRSASRSWRSVMVGTYRIFSEWFSLIAKTRSSQVVNRLLDRHLSALPKARVGRRSHAKMVQKGCPSFLFGGSGIPPAATGLIHPVWAKVAMAVSDFCQLAVGDPRLPFRCDQKRRSTDSEGSGSPNGPKQPIWA